MLLCVRLPSGLFADVVLVKGGKLRDDVEGTVQAKFPETLRPAVDHVFEGYPEPNAQFPRGLYMGDNDTYCRNAAGPVPPENASQHANRGVYSSKGRFRYPSSLPPLIALGV